MPQETVNVERLVEMITDDDRLLVVLEAAVAYQEEHVETDHWREYDHTGFEATDVGAQGWEFRKLAQAGVVQKAYSSNSSTYWRLGHRDRENEEWTHFHDQAATAIALATEDTAPEAEVEHESMEDVDPEALFEDVVGREKPKKWLRRTIDNLTQVHHLLYGPPGGGKSEVLDDILELPGAERLVFTGEQTSAAGVNQLLREKRPRFLVVEELEKGAKKDRQALMTLCGKGYIEETKADGRGDQKIALDTIVLATANDLEAITPDSLVDRFMTWEFAQYDYEEFETVCREVLPRETGVNSALAVEIAGAVHDKLGSTQVREARRIAQLAEDTHEVAELVGAIDGTTRGP